MSDDGQHLPSPLKEDHKGNLTTGQGSARIKDP